MLKMRPGALGGSLVAILCAGCVERVGAPESTLWEARLRSQSVPPQPLSGTAAAISRTSATSVSIKVIEADPGASYPWQIRTGTCGTEGELIVPAATYPMLVASDSGTANAGVVISRVLEEAATYQVVVLGSALPGVTEIAACGDLEQVGS